LFEGKVDEHAQALCSGLKSAHLSPHGLFGRAIAGLFHGKDTGKQLVGSRE
jgi:hypothetical protein